MKYPVRPLYPSSKNCRTSPDKPYEVIGIITPPDDEYETEAEAVHAMRMEAAKHGADAVFIESQTQTSG